MLTASSEYGQFHRLFWSGERASARTLAEAQSEASTTADVRAFWLLQLGYAWFLDHGRPESSERAVAAFRRAERESPDDPWPAFWLGYLHVLFPRLDLDNANSLESADRGPERPYIRLVMGRRDYGTGDYAAAARRFQSVLGVTSTFLGALWELIRTSLPLGTQTSDNARPTPSSPANHSSNRRRGS